MRCVILTQYFPPDMGGGSARSSNVARGLRAAGHDVLVVTAIPHYPLGTKPARYAWHPFRPRTWRLWRTEDVGGLRVIRVWMPPIAHNSYLKRVLQHGVFCAMSLLVLPRAFGSRVVFASSPGFFVMFPAIIYRFALRAKLVRGVDDLWPEVFYDLGLLRPRFVRAAVDRVSAFTYRMSHAIAPISPAYVDPIVEKYHVPRERIEVIEVGVDTERFHPLPRPAGERFVVMYSGILGILYDFRSLLVAAKRLEQVPQIEFVIRGVGEQEGEIRSLIASLSLKNVRLDCTLVDADDLNGVLNEASVFVVPMVDLAMADRGLPTKLFENQALGSPTIVASSGESARFITTTNSGVAVPPEDPAALAAAILAMYNDPAGTRQMGDAALAYATTYLDVPKIGVRMSRLFERALLEGDTREKTEAVGYD